MHVDTWPTLETVDLPELGVKQQGKVRDIYRQDSTRTMITTDRISAFDRVIGLVPGKGQVLNGLSQYWFEHTRHIVGNHMLAVPDPNVMVVRECEPYPVEIIVRGYITGVTATSIWTSYAKGERMIYGLHFPDGLRKNDRLPQPVITPTTHAATGQHDERLTRDQIVRDLIPEDEYRQIEAAALALFAYGTQVCAQGGLILVDTKYEFGKVDGTLTLMDEVHTPDSSRFWVRDSYDERIATGQEPENFDKEFVRTWLKAQGYSGDGPTPALPADLVAQVAERYIVPFERITGRAFEPPREPINERIRANLQAAGYIAQSIR